MKKMKLVLLGLMASVMLLAGCGSGSSKERGSAAALEHAEATGLESPVEGTTGEGDGYTWEVAWSGDGKTDIFGRIYYPKDFDENKTYPTIVMCHGGSGNADSCGKMYAPKLAAEGYICYTFDCRGGMKGGRGSYSTELANGDGPTIATYTEDMSMALDLMKSKSFVDQDHIYLFGLSKGGGTTQNLGYQRADEIAGLIVVYGSVAEDNKGMMPDYDAFTANPYNNGEVLFVQGTEDETLTAERTISNMELYENATLIDISATKHGFGFTEDRATLTTCEAVVDFIERDLAGDDYQDYSAATEEDRNAKDEGYTVNGDGYTSVVSWFTNGDNDMFGRFYYPENFTEDESYPVVVFCHGASVNADFWDAVYAPALAQEGYVCFTYDCRSSGAGLRGSYSTPIEGDVSTVDDYTSDTNAAIDFVKSKEFIDTDSIYLCGSSKGGMTIQSVASERPEEIKGLIVLYGTLQDPFRREIAKYDDIWEHPYNHGEVLMMLGAKDSISPEATLKNMELYEKSTLLYISGGIHGFGKFNNRAGQISTDEMINFLNRTMASEE